ncbi:MAG: hypothetical protein ACLFVQ_13500 [Chitinispirillaceae bacterium]
MHSKSGDKKGKEKKNEKEPVVKNRYSEADSHTGDIPFDPDLPTDEDIRVMAFDDNMSGLAEAVRMDTDQGGTIKEQDIAI